MRRFLGRPQVAMVVDANWRPLATSDGRANWDVLENLAFEDDDGEMVTALKGTRTDFGSIPSLAWSLGYPPDGIGLPGYIIHDFLCATKGAGWQNGQLGITRDKPYSPEESAGVLKRCLAFCGVPTGHRERIYRAVLAGGPKW